MAVTDVGGRHWVERIYGKELFFCIVKGFQSANQESRSMGGIDRGCLIRSFSGTRKGV
jgi:hypothetical protein